MEIRENIRVRKTVANVKGKNIEFDEYYLIDPLTGEEKFDRQIEIENDARLYDIYKKQVELLTSQEIKNIRKKYQMTQKEYALSIGVGEITIHRFENGSIQTEAVDAIMRLSDDPDNMCNLLIKNQINLSEENYQVFMKRINELQRLKRHCIAKFNFNDFIDTKFETVDANVLANNVIFEYNTRIDRVSEQFQIEDMCGNAEYITPLKLQKLLYYIQGISLKIFGVPAFLNRTYAWSYGPVVDDVYQNYKGRTPIDTPSEKKDLSEGLQKIIEIVIDSYGQIEAGKLINLTHNEDPWINTEKNSAIEIGKIRDYFDKVYDI